MPRSGPGPATGRSSTMIAPSSTGRKPPTRYSSVLLPQPLGPKSATNSRSRTGRMVEILLGEGEREPLLRQLGHRSGDLERRLAVFLIEEPAHRADMVLEEIDQHRPVGGDEIGLHRPHHRLDRPDRVAPGE